jgi:hypothetical protein
VRTIKAEDKIKRYNHRKPPTGEAVYMLVCAACGVQLNGTAFDADQRVSGWPVCKPCFLEQ